MVGLSRNPRVIQLARDLDLPSRGDCVDAIRAHARRQVDELVRTSPIPINTLETLRRMVANRFRARLELISTDEDVARIAGEHAGFARHLHRRLVAEFLDGSTEGITLGREEHDPVLFRYLIVVDARGERASRAYFTAWHELSHLLVHPPQLSFPGFRRTPARAELEKDPLEQLVDHIAGHVAFYEPLFRPAVEGAFAAAGRVTFAAIDDARARAAIPDASLYATAIQAITHTTEPVALVTVDHVLKPSEARRLRSPQQDLGLMPAPIPQPQLRVTACIRNPAAESSGITIWRHMRVPTDSVLARPFSADATPQNTWVAEEDQSWWSTSDRGALPPLPLCVEVLQRGRFVYALIGVKGAPD